MSPRALFNVTRHGGCGIDRGVRWEKGRTELVGCLVDGGKETPEESGQTDLCLLKLERGRIDMVCSVFPFVSGLSLGV